MVEAKLKWVGGRRFEGVSTWGFPIATDISKNSGGAESGYRPTELLMFALAGCTGVDVVNILEKMRQKITSVEVTVTGQQPESFPKPFNHIEVKYLFRGENLDREKVRQAVELSEGKYCSVSQTLAGVAKIVSTIEIVEE